MEIFERHLRALAGKCVAQWPRLPIIRPGEVLVRIYYEEIVRPENGGGEAVEFVEDCVVVGTLETRGPFSADGGNAEGLEGDAEGFDVVIRRFAYDNWLRSTEAYDMVESEELLRETYYAAGGRLSLSSGEGTDSEEDADSGEDTE